MATHIYEKGPQTLIDTISEVEKLNATEQLMAMIIPPSIVNVMSNRRIAVSCVKNQDMLHDIALILGAMNAMNMVISSWTVRTEYLLQEL